MIQPEAPSFYEVLARPKTGDLLCFDGLEWKVARRDGWHYPVEDQRIDATGWAEAAFDVPMLTYEHNVWNWRGPL